MKNPISASAIPLSLVISISMSGCRSQPLSPAEVNAQFIQAATEQNLGKMSILLSRQETASALQLQHTYHTPESDKDPMLRGETLEMWAIRTGRFKSAFALLNTAPNVKNAFGRTPLMYAALYDPEVGPDAGFVDVVTQATNSFEDVDNNGDSALFLALRRGALDSTTRLLRLGPTDFIHSRNKRGQTALDVAKEGKNKVLIAIIAQKTQLQMRRHKLLHSKNVK